MQIIFRMPSDIYVWSTIQRRAFNLFICCEWIVFNCKKLYHVYFGIWFMIIEVQGNRALSDLDISHDKNPMHRSIEPTQRTSCINFEYSLRSFNTSIENAKERCILMLCVASQREHLNLQSLWLRIFFLRNCRLSPEGLMIMA